MDTQNLDQSCVQTARIFWIRKLCQEVLLGQVGAPIGMVGSDRGGLPRFLGWIEVKILVCLMGPGIGEFRLGDELFGCFVRIKE